MIPFVFHSIVRIYNVTTKNVQMMLFEYRQRYRGNILRWASLDRLGYYIEKERINYNFSYHFLTLQVMTGCNFSAEKLAASQHFPNNVICDTAIIL